MQDIGGSAEVTSAPGSGTTVKLRWSATSTGDNAVADLVAVAIEFHGSLSAIAILIGIFFSIGILQFGAIAIFRLLNSNVDTAAGVVKLLNALETDRATLAAIVEDRAAPDRELERELFPLVRGMADGSLDPDADGIRRRCDVAAGILRAVITHDDGTASVAPLDAVAVFSQAARAHGVVLDARIDPGIEQVPAPVRDRLLAIVTATLTLAKPGEASLTIHGAAPSATATICLPLAVPVQRLHREASTAAVELAASAGGAARTDLEPLDGDRVWLEITWQSRAVPA